MSPFLFVTPSTRGLSLALTRELLKSTKFPVFATHRSSASEVKENILSPLKDVDPDRLHLLSLDLTSEDSIAAAAESMAKALLDKESRIHTAFLTGGVLHAEKQPADLDLEKIQHTFNINVISHLLLIKHFSQFLPLRAKSEGDPLAKWVHVSARVGSIEDNKAGGWYSYRSSKAALNQVAKTFDKQLQMKKSHAMAVAYHPGTVKTDLSKGFWGGVEEDKLFEPEDAARKLIDVVGGLKEDQRGQVWDWAGKRVAW